MTNMARGDKRLWRDIPHYDGSQRRLVVDHDRLKRAFSFLMRAFHTAEGNRQGNPDTESRSM